MTIVLLGVVCSRLCSTGGPNQLLNPSIEQGGNSLYPAMAQRATSVEVLRILISIGPTENDAFSNLVGQGWQLASSDSSRPADWCVSQFSRPELFAIGVARISRGISSCPESCPFISRKLPPCSVIRPMETNGIAMAVVNFLTRMGL